MKTLFCIYGKNSLENVSSHSTHIENVNIKYMKNTCFVTLLLQQDYEKQYRALYFSQQWLLTGVSL